MLESIKAAVAKWVQPICSQVLSVENSMPGASGAEKLEAVVNAIAGKFDVPYLPSFIETPLKRTAVKYFANLAVEKLNWLFDWDFKGAVLSPETTDKLASVVEAPIPALAKIAKSSAAASALSVEERLDMLCKDYQVSTAAAAEFAVLPEVAPVIIGTPWDKAFAFVLAREGGYVNDPDDKGGETNMGITAATLASACAAGLVGHANVETLTGEEAKMIYHANYWDRYGWGGIDWPASLCLFDATVNHGGGGMAKIAQRTANALGWALDVDGKFGPKTFESIQKITEADAAGYTEEFLRQRKKFYDEIIEANASQAKFKNGWHNRLKALAEAAGVESPV